MEHFTLFRTSAQWGVLFNIENRVLWDRIHYYFNPHYPDSNQTYERITPSSSAPFLQGNRARSLQKKGELSGPAVFQKTTIGMDFAATCA
jgi:hypothetical protein